MPYETDQALKGYLDTNQLAREQMCLALLAIDGRFSNVRPRHPRGGPDGGRDMDADYEDAMKTFGAVGFINQADDSAEQKRRISKKFEDDLRAAIASGESPEVFVFMTNLNLSSGEKDALKKQAVEKGFKVCDVFDRERLRVLLDSADGFAIRFQYLNITLSQAEQATFFARWGKEINSVIATRFQVLERKLNRLLFLQEAQESLGTLSITLQLNRVFNGDEIGHFRLFCAMYFFGLRDDVFHIEFGASDKSDRFRGDSSTQRPVQPAGIQHSIGRGQWEVHPQANLNNNDDESLEKYTSTGSGWGVGLENLHALTIQYSNAYALLGYQRPRLRLMDLDQASYVLLMNASLAAKLAAIQIRANGYKIGEYRSDELSIEEPPQPVEVAVSFSEQELKDKWVIIRPATGSTFFSISYFDSTPARAVEWVDIEGR